MATRAGACYHATGGSHNTSDDVFKSLEVGKRKAVAKELAKMKESCIGNMVLQEDCHNILIGLDGQPPNGKQLKKLLKWQGKKYVGKATDLEAWNALCVEHEASGKDVIFALPTVERWTTELQQRLDWLMTAEIDMSETAVGRLLTLEKRNLLAAAQRAEVLEAFGMNPEILDEDDKDDASEMDSDAV
jgi:hypothetical protein